jgi:hypothetical protein
MWSLIMSTNLLRAVAYVFIAAGALILVGWIAFRIKDRRQERRFQAKMRQRRTRINPEGLYVTDYGQVLNRIHPDATCSGRCPIHAPSNHHMATWPLHWNEAFSFMERACGHGLFHPDPDDIKVRALGQDRHRCDGCCTVSQTQIHVT